MKFLNTQHFGANWHHLFLWRQPGTQLRGEFIPPFPIQAPCSTPEALNDQGCVPVLDDSPHLGGCCESQS